MLITILRRHLSYEPNKAYDVPDETAQLYIRNGLAVPVETESVITMDEGTHIPAAAVKKILKNKGGRPRNKPQE